MILVRLRLRNDSTTAREHRLQYIHYWPNVVAFVMLGEIALSSQSHNRRGCRWTIVKNLAPFGVFGALSIARPGSECGPRPECAIAVKHQTTPLQDLGGNTRRRLQTDGSCLLSLSDRYQLKSGSLSRRTLQSGRFTCWTAWLPRPT